MFAVIVREEVLGIISGRRAQPSGNEWAARRATSDNDVCDRVERIDGGRGHYCGVYGFPCTIIRIFKESEVVLADHRQHLYCNLYLYEQQNSLLPQLHLVSCSFFSASGWPIRSPACIGKCDSRGRLA